MNIIETGLEGCWIIEPKIFADHRGYFFESFNKGTFAKKTGMDIEFVQDNQAKSNFGVLRGLHFQEGEYAQAKLVRVFQGKVLDVVVDLRPASKTFGKHFTVELSGENQLQMFVPRGFAHGYSVLSETAVFVYKCDNLYAPAHEAGIHYGDPELNINWGLKQEEMLISDKDLILPNLSTYLESKSVATN